MLKAARFVLRTIRKVHPFDAVDELLCKIRSNLYDAGCVDVGMPYEPNAKEIGEKLAQQVKDLLAAQQEDERLYKETTEHNVANKCKEWDKLATSLEKEGKFEVNKNALGEFNAIRDSKETYNNDEVYVNDLTRLIKLMEFPTESEQRFINNDSKLEKEIRKMRIDQWLSQVEKYLWIKKEKENQPKRKKGRPKHKLNSPCVAYMEDPGKRMEKLIKDEKRMKKDV